MAISDAAKANHDQLFGDRVSTRAQTDPELIAYFDNFAPFIGYPRTLDGLAALNDVIPS